ncbi:MAG: hypothetical protein KF729_24020 [Sandaracinaceae bacterium]|nr:hypothetical protein [Sandaracinaceae bacterium]
MIRWAAVVMSGFVVAGGPGLAVAPGEIDWLGGTRDFLERASAKGRLGVRVGLLLAMSAPLWCWGRLTTAARLSPEERARLLAELLSHRVFFVRELMLLLKLVACMALLRPAAVRARTGYDRPAPAARGERLLPSIREVA